MGKPKKKTREGDFSNDPFKGEEAMALLTRRTLLKGFAFSVFVPNAYAFGVEPIFRLTVASYALDLPRWPADFPLRIAVISDIHFCEPYMTIGHVESICYQAMNLDPDLIVILGDFHGGHSFATRAIWPEEWAPVLGLLKAPLGVYTILGNHDWWHGPLPSMKGDHAESIRHALRSTSIELLENDVIRLKHEGRPFWLAGLGDQMAYIVSHGRFKGSDDLEGTLQKVKDDAPLILLAHEPDVFARVPERVALTLSGHTHGGQVNIPFIGSPFANKRFGKNRYYGHIMDQNRHMIISAGLGTSILPIRFMRPPEIVEILLGPAESKYTLI